MALTRLVMWRACGRYARDLASPHSNPQTVYRVLERVLLAALEALRALGTCMDELDKFGHSFVHRLCRAGNARALAVVVRAGVCCPNARTRQGLSPCRFF